MTEIDDLHDARRGDVVERFLATQDELTRHLDADTPRQTWRTMAGRIGGDFAALYLHLAGEELAFNPPHLRSVLTAKRKLREAGREAGPFMGQCLDCADVANGAAVDHGDTWPKKQDHHRYAILTGMHANMLALVTEAWGDPAAHSTATEFSRRAEEIATALGTEAAITPANDTHKEPINEPA